MNHEPSRGSPPDSLRSGEWGHAAHRWRWPNDAERSDNVGRRGVLLWLRRGEMRNTRLRSSPPAAVLARAGRGRGRVGDASHPPVPFPASWSPSRSAAIPPVFGTPGVDLALLTGTAAHVQWRVAPGASPERQYRADARRGDLGRRRQIQVTEEFRFFVGIDWGNETHQVCVVDANGTQILESSVAHDGEAIAALVDRVLALGSFEPEVFAVAMEAPRGTMVEAFLDRGAAVFSINPKQVDRFRDRYTVAGAKDDRLDAYVLANSLRTDRPLYRRLALDEAAIVELRALVRARDEVQQDVLRLGSRLREQLHRYYPQILELGSVYEDAWLWEVFELAPTPEQARHLQRAKVAAVLSRRRIRRVDAEEVVRTLKKKPVPVAPGVVEGARRHAELLIPRLRLALEQRRECDRGLQGLLLGLSSPESGSGEAPSGPKTHRDAEIVLSLVGVGVVTGATMLAEAGRLLRNRDYQGLRVLTGVAPVRRQTGKQGKNGRPAPVHMRRACSSRLRDAVHHWASVSVQHDPRSKSHYGRLRAAGHSHGRALRGVADRLLAMLVAMLKRNEPYDPARRAAVAA
jgi:transposase